MNQTQRTAVPSYEHTQRGTMAWIAPLIGVVISATLVLRAMARAPGAARSEALLVMVPVSVLIFGIMVLIAISFSNLTVRVNADAVEWSFRGGMYRNRIPLDAIASAEIVHNEWWMGIGVHFIGSGWLYNVAGGDAVELRPHPGAKLPLGATRLSVFRDSKERVRLGTDEPERLRDAIRDGIRKAQPT